jgi:gliding motility-associated-like protein
MKKIIYFLTSLIISTSSVFSQNICLGDDATICAGQSVTIEACPGSGGSSPNNIGTVTPINLNVDDGFSGVIPIGFNFDFYGNTYNQVVVSSNMYLSFDITQANGYSPWSINNAIPNPANPLNAIMYPWQDINPSASPTDFIGYKTVGTAPNRKFYIVYKNIPMFNSTIEACSGVILYEGSNKIETILDEKPLNAGWNGGAAIHGLHNINGTLADFVPGRNYPTQWTANLDSWEFVPNGTNAYNVNQIPYEAIVVDNVDFTWQDTEGNVYPASGNTLTTTPVPTPPSDSIGYFVNYSSCATIGLQTSDTTWITVNTVTVAINGTDDFCSQAIGEATALANGGSVPYTYSWNDPMNQTTQTATGLTSGNYTVTVTDAIGCQGTANIIIGDTPIALTTSYTQVSCPAGSDGTATVVITPAPASATYDWFDAGNQNTATATGLSAGTYNVAIETDLGCQDTATVLIDEIPGMIVNLVSSEDVTCNSGNDGQAVINVTDGTAPYTYSWNTSGETTANPTSLIAGTNTVTITDDNGCTIDFDVDLGEPNALQLISVSSDTIACVDDSVMLYATGAGGSSNYTYTWKSSGNFVGTGDTIHVTPTSDNTSYCVTLSEQCGSPETQECLTITYPEEIIPLISPDNTGACVPVEVNFENVTSTNETIDFTVWNYGDGTSDTVQGASTASHSYDVGLFDVSVEVVSDRGCIYTRTFNSLIEGYSYPNASFYVNPNPASVFEPEVDIFSQSSGDVISFQWFAEDAEPNFSTLENPTFQYPIDEIANYPLILVVENGNGCRDTVERLVRIQNEVLIFAPNTFTPDSDGANDKWRVYIQGIDISSFHLELYNRWGELIFESFDPEGAWDGTYGGMGIVKGGTYIWKIQARDAENDNKYEFKGFVNVLK